MNGVVAQYWSIIPGGIHQVLHEAITGVDTFYVFGIEECSSADWNAQSGVNLPIILMECDNIVLFLFLTPNSKNILFTTTLVFFYGVHCTQVNLVHLAS